MTRAPRWIRCLLAILATGVTIAFPVGASAASSDAATSGIGIRLVDVPVAEQDNPRALLYIVDHLVPGTVIQRRIDVSNTTASTAHVVLYPAAASIANVSNREARKRGWPSGRARASAR